MRAGCKCRRVGKPSFIFSSTKKSLSMGGDTDAIFCLWREVSCYLVVFAVGLVLNTLKAPIVQSCCLLCP